MEENKKWGFKKNEPNIIFKVRLLGSNRLIEYYLQEDKKRHSTWLDETVFIDEKDVPLERKQEYDDLYRGTWILTVDYNGEISFVLSLGK